MNQITFVVDRQLQCLRGMMQNNTIIRRKIKKVLEGKKRWYCLTFFYMKLEIYLLLHDFSTVIRLRL